MIRRPPRSTRKESSAASDVYKRQVFDWQQKIGVSVSAENGVLGLTLHDSSPINTAALGSPYIVMFIRVYMVCVNAEMFRQNLGGLLHSGVKYWPRHCNIGFTCNRWLFIFKQYIECYLSTMRDLGWVGVTCTNAEYFTRRINEKWVIADYY